MANVISIEADTIYSSIVFWVLIMSGDNNQSFWTTLPGILTGIAAVITAISGILFTLNSLGMLDINGDTPVLNNEREGENVEDIPAAHEGSSSEIVNGINIEFVRIPAGDFLMGSPPEEENREENEGPVHKVTIDKAFDLSKYEITQKQWREVMGNNPSFFNGDNLPVEQVSWNDAQDFIRKLNEREGTDKYRLPSESEWEYACRAGSSGAYYFGNDESLLGNYAWYDDNANKTHRVGQKESNPWGLYDMHGNVKEWVQDTWHNSYNGAPSDGSAWENGSSSDRVCRGGSWRNPSENCRSAFRGREPPESHRNNVGIRLVREV